MIRNCAVVLLALIVGGCATGHRNTGYESRTTLTEPSYVPEYVQNLPKSRTGNMAHYTVFGKRYQVMDSAANFSEQGKASWYGTKFHGRKTSSSEIYDMYAMTAAHKHLPLPTYVRVTNLENDKSIIVKVNDRGPFVGERIIDLSLAAAQALDMVEQGTANVRVDGLSTHIVSTNTSTQAPEVVEPQLTAVPLPSVPVPSAVVVDSSEDGFVESTALKGPSNNPYNASTENFFIQIGAFSSAPNAQSLVENVAEQVGLPAFVEQDASRTMFRVKMGPFKQGELLDNTLVELANVGIEGYTLQAVTR